MLVGEAKPKQIITIKSPMGKDVFFLITELQNDENGPLTAVGDPVRAYEQLGGGVVYLNPTKSCELVTTKIFRG